MDPVQRGFWVPLRLWTEESYLIPLHDYIEELRRAGRLPALSPVVRSFRAWLDSHGRQRALLQSMIQEHNVYVRGLRGCRSADCQRRWGDADLEDFFSYQNLFHHLNLVIHATPEFNRSVLVGVPLSWLLAVAMVMPSGQILFRDDAFNAEFKKVLDAWNAFLTSPASLDKLDIAAPEKPGSWISEEAHTAGVWTDMVHDPAKPGYGYSSWNAFFLRKFVPGARPFHGDGAAVVNIGCETTPWRYKELVNEVDEFWIKDMPYSLLDVFGGNKDWATKFSGGTVYQGYLSAVHYHRWHAPVEGRVVQSWLCPGSYMEVQPNLSETQGLSDDFDNLPYLSHVATRAIVIMEHPRFGYVALIFVGMGEVSTCHIHPEFRVTEGAPPVPVTRGQEIGHFEFGGSTHVMIFQRGRAVLERWAVEAGRDREIATAVPVRMGTVIARLP